MDVKEMRCRIDDTIKFFRELSEDAYISKGKFCDGCRGMFCGAYNVYVNDLNAAWNYISAKNIFYSVHSADEPKSIDMKRTIGPACIGVMHVMNFFNDKDNIAEIEKIPGYEREKMEDYFQSRLKLLNELKNYIVKEGEENGAK